MKNYTVQLVFRWLDIKGRW